MRALAQLVVSDVHPLNTARVIDYLNNAMRLPQDQQQAWLRHWILSGRGALELLLAKDSCTGLYCHGDAPTLADVCLIPQVFMARHFGCDLSTLPTIVRIYDHYMAHPAFHRATPPNQPDVPTA